jgi:hypothetical protein
MTEPEPCPHCKGPAKIHSEALDERYGYAHRTTVICTVCGCRSPSCEDKSNPKGGYAIPNTGAPKALAAWNRRA